MSFVAIWHTKDPNVFRRAELRKRKREERHRNTAELVERMKARQRDHEAWRQRRRLGSLPGGVYPWLVGVAVVVGGVLYFKYFSLVT